jgi:hypothetical protein
VDEKLATTGRLEGSLEQYECALTGQVVDGSPADTHTKDGDMPVGWTKITMTRRMYNPSWLLIQQVKNRMIQGLLAQLPPEIQQAEELAIRLQVEAQFASLENLTPRYERDFDETIYLSDSGDVFDSLNEAREALGMERVAFEDTNGSDDEDDEEDEEEGEGEDGGDEADPAVSDSD